MSDYWAEMAESREIASAIAPQLYELDSILRERPQSRESGIILWLEDPRAYYLARHLDRFDREFRRTTASTRIGTVPIEESLTESLTVSRLALEGVFASENDERERVVERPKGLRRSLHGI